MDATTRATIEETLKQGRSSDEDKKKDEKLDRDREMFEAGLKAGWPEVPEDQLKILSGVCAMMHDMAHEMLKCALEHTVKAAIESGRLDLALDAQTLTNTVQFAGTVIGMGMAGSAVRDPAFVKMNETMNAFVKARKQ